MKCCKFSATAIVAVIAVATMAAPSRAATLSAANLDLGALVHTTGVANAARGIANDRNLRQSFTLSSPIQVDTVQIGFDTSDQNAGLQMRVYQVSDANSNPWSPIGGPVIDLLLAAYDATATANAVPDVGAGSSTNALQIDLEGDAFTLNSGTWAIEFSTDDPNQLSNVGTWSHSNIDPNDFYPAGLMYTESGNLSQPYRDFNLSILGSVIPEPSSLLLACTALLLSASRRK